MKYIEGEFYVLKSTYCLNIYQYKNTIFYFVKGFPKSFEFIHSKSIQEEHILYKGTVRVLTTEEKIEHL